MQGRDLNPGLSEFTSAPPQSFFLPSIDDLIAVQRYSALADAHLWPKLSRQMQSRQQESSIRVTTLFAKNMCFHLFDLPAQHLARWALFWVSAMVQPSSTYLYFFGTTAMSTHITFKWISGLRFVCTQTLFVECEFNSFKGNPTLKFSNNHPI